VEVLVVLAMSAILLGLTVPHLRSYFVRTQDDLLQAQLLRTIQFAQVEARARRVPVAICKTKNNNTCSGHWNDGQLVFVNENEDGIVHDKKQILAVMQPLASQGMLHLRSFPIYRDYLLFLPTGFMHSDNGTFWYCHTADKLPVWAILLGQSGRTRVLYPDKWGEIKDSKDKLLVC